MKKVVLCALVCAGLAAGNVSAAQPLDGVAITATFNGLADGILGLDSGYASNVSHVGPTDYDVEFYTTDFLFAVDFTSSGLVTVYNTSDSTPTGSYLIDFDFAGLSSPISSFTFASETAAGSPLLTVVNGHNASIDLSGVAWTGGSGYNSVSAQLNFTSAVPEPTVPAMLLAGLGAMALRRRKNT